MCVCVGKGAGGGGGGLPALEAFSSGTRKLMLAYPGGDPYDGLYTGKLSSKGVPFKGLGI